VGVSRLAQGKTPPPSAEYATKTVETSRKTPELNIGLIGTGLMAKSHSMAYLNAAPVFGPLPAKPKLSVICDQSEDLARQGAESFGFERWTTDWRSMVEDPSIDVVDIVTPNFLHKEMALGAISGGKHVYCEKPLAANAADAKEMYEAADKAGVNTLVGFNYLFNPAVALARELIQSGELGELRTFTGSFVLDAVADPDIPFTWRFDRELAGAGALGDVGAHTIAMARTLMGEITSVCASARTFVKERPDTTGAFGYASAAEVGSSKRAVENDDTMHFLCDFENGAMGSIESDRVATGRTWDNSFSVSGSRGTLHFSQQRSYELQMFINGDPEGQRGFRSVNMGPEHGYYGKFWPFAGVPLGLHELKTVEVFELLSAVAEERPAEPGFREGWEVSRVIDAVTKSAEERRWVDVRE
jgi:predicted dehydrogenase